MGLNSPANLAPAAHRQGTLPAGIVKGTPSERYCLPGALTCTVPVSPAIKPYLDLFQAPNTPDLGDGTAFFIAAPLQTTKENYFMTRIDHQISGDMRIFGRYSFDQDKNVVPNFNGSAIAA